jgi:hypothetical protein
MGYQLLDQYSLLHFATGIVIYFWNIPFLFAILGHMLFEYVENTKGGMAFINKYIIDPGYFSWPGGKHEADSGLNQLGDNITFALGFALAAFLDVVGTRNNWYVAK